MLCKLCPLSSCVMQAAGYNILRHCRQVAQVHGRVLLGV
jgi:hypothetical protein